jgi:hypothetical protein
MPARLSHTSMAHALFVSPLQPSEHPAARRVRTAIAAAIRRHRTAAACAALTAQEFGEHPETAAPRMRWALATARAAGPRAPGAPPPLPCSARAVCTPAPRHRAAAASGARDQPPGPRPDARPRPIARARREPRCSCGAGGVTAASRR